MHAYAEDRIHPDHKVLASAYLIEFTQADALPGCGGERQRAGASNASTDERDANETPAQPGFDSGCFAGR